MDGSGLLVVETFNVKDVGWEGVPVVEMLNVETYVGAGRSLRR